MEVNPTEKFIKYHCFLYKEFSRFVIKDLLGSVPSMMDGLKTTQRKVLFAAMENLKEKKRVISELEFSHDVNFIVHQLYAFEFWCKLWRKKFGL